MFHARAVTDRCRRWMLSEIEDYPLLAIRCAQALAMSVMLGVVYWQMHPDQKTIRDHFGLLYMISVMYPYLIIIDIIESCWFLLSFTISLSFFQCSVSLLSLSLPSYIGNVKLFHENSLNSQKKFFQQFSDHDNDNDQLYLS